MTTDLAQLKPGARLRSRVCETEVIVVKAPATALRLECGGVPMAAAGEPAEADPAHADLDPGHAGGAVLGKRYADEELGLEVLCTHGGQGSLSVDGEVLHPKDAKPLPSSD